MADVTSPRGTSRSTNDSVKSVRAYIASKLLGGDNITITETLAKGEKVITITATADISSVLWGNIVGDINTNEELTAALGLKYDDDSVINGGDSK